MRQEVNQAKGVCSKRRVDPYAAHAVHCEGWMKHGCWRPTAYAVFAIRAGAMSHARQGRQSSRTKQLYLCSLCGSIGLELNRLARGGAGESGTARHMN